MFRSVITITAIMLNKTVWVEEAPIQFESPEALLTAPSQVLDRCKELGGFLRIISQDVPEIEFVPINSIERINIKVGEVTQVSSLATSATTSDVKKAAADAENAKKLFDAMRGGKVQA